ncbi:MAG: DUF433 domain-containing protein [Armatimonadetes bacterium]|nr:DUF433 domain-containing protein [Armatimonadota bacterium]
MDMPSTTEPWLITELKRLAITQPEKFDQIADHLRAFHGPLFEKLALSALEHGVLEPEECAICLATDVSSVAMRLEIFRRDVSEDGNTLLIEKDARGVARVTGSEVKVWEIVREYRKRGSIEDLAEAYSGFTAAELRAALRYGEEHTEEIDAKIHEYESFFANAKNSFMKSG